MQFLKSRQQCNTDFIIGIVHLTKPINRKVLAIPIFRA
jgi:hypothetical protein